MKVIIARQNEAICRGQPGALGQAEYNKKNAAQLIPKAKSLPHLSQPSSLSTHLKNQAK